MALEIERILESRFEFSLDGGDPISDNAPNLTTFGNICHFKTRNGANIIANQNVTYADVTVIDTYGGTGSFTFANIQALWVKLIALQFFDGLATGGGGTATRFDVLLDTFTYFGNDGKVPVVDESQLELVATTFYNFNEFTQLEDVSITTLIDGKILGVALVSGVPKIVLTDPAEATNEYFSAVGGFYYADLTSQTTPQAYTTGDLQLENDIEGDNTFLTQPPYGITSVWDESTNTFDFSQLSIGDEIILRVDLLVTTSAANQTSNVSILLGEGETDERTLLLETFYTETVAETAMTSKINFTIQNEDWRTTAAKLLFSSDASADIEVVGFHPYIIRKSVNVLDVNDNTFKTFTIVQLASPTVDVNTNAGTVKIGYEGVGDKLTNILFDLAFSKYLVNLDTLLSTKNIEIVIYNKTKGKFLSANVDSFTEPSTGYYNAVLDEYIDLADVSVNDELDINFSVSDIAGGGGITSVVQDTTPQLGGSLDTNSKSIEWSKGADVASATELLLLRDGNYFDVTGTTTIATIEDSADAWKIGSIVILQFDGILTLTHSADLSLPTAANITTAAGDIAFMQKVASGDWKCVSYQRADGTPLAGGGGDLLAANNLSDVASAATSRTNLGINTTANQTDSTDKRFMTDAQEAKIDYLTVTQAVDLDQMETDIAALANGMVYKDDWDASSGSFPGGGSAEIGWFYNVSVAGTVDSVEFAIGDSIIAKVDNASTTTYAANWVKKDQTDAVQSVAGEVGTISASSLRSALNIEDGADVTDAANVDAAGATMNTDTTLAGNSYFLDEDNMASDSATKVPSQQSVKAYVDTEIAAIPVELGFACSDETTDLAAATSVLTFRMPYAMTLTEVRATVGTAPTGSAITVDINKTAVSILSTKITIDATEKTSETAVTAPVISDSSLADDAEITIDIDGVGSTIAGAGLKVWLIGTRT